MNHKQKRLHFFLLKIKVIKPKDKILWRVKMCLSGHLMQESIRQHHQGKQMKYEAPFYIPARKAAGVFDMLKMCLPLCWLLIGIVRKNDLSTHSFTSPPFVAVFFPSRRSAPALQADTWALPLLPVRALTSVPSGAARSYGNRYQIPCKSR